LCNQFEIILTRYHVPPKAVVIKWGAQFLTIQYLSSQFHAIGYTIQFYIIDTFTKFVHLRVILHYKSRVIRFGLNPDGMHVKQMD